MKRLPLDVSSFKLMIEGDYLYIDKTRIIFDLLRDRRLFFLARPRRFGKSLLISTLVELFSGNKTLFEKTWIGQTGDYLWQEHPVVYLDFSILNKTTAQEFGADLGSELEVIAAKYAVTLVDSIGLGAKFRSLLRRLALKNTVVILIDEYDYPLLANINQLDIAEEIKKVIRDFFTIIKSLDVYIRCVFITGVTRFSKASIFSGMNNLNDITMHSDAAALLGYTENEIKQELSWYVQRFADAKNMSIEQVYALMQEWYNGYRFSDAKAKVYNPYSVIHALHAQKFSNYWLATGTPSFLVELLKSKYHDIEELKKTELSGASLGTFELEHIPLITLLFQTGYLTISDYDATTNRYKLAYPNAEVTESFKHYIIEAMSRAQAYEVDQSITQCRKALEAEDLDSFLAVIRGLFAHIPYQLHINKEAYYHTLFHVILDLLGFSGQSEVSTSRGRADLVLETHVSIYVFEFKIDSDPQAALEQIENQQYYEKYVRYNKPLTLVGLAFNFKNKTLTLDYVVKRVV